MDNKTLQQMVLDELEFDPRIDAASIGVTANDGVVTLLGHVGSFAEKYAAEELARRVKGVHAVAQEIEVRYPNHKKTSDDEIAERALRIIKWDTTIPDDAIQVTVQHGLVTLNGQVDWHFQRYAAESSVRKLSGVIGVVNDVYIKPVPAAADLKRKIESALNRRAQLEANSIRVNVSGANVVTLEGQVDCWDERQAVEQAAWSVAGVRSVNDQLTVR